MRLTTLLNERQRRLTKWNDKVAPVAEWLTEKEEFLSSPVPDSLDHDAARKHRNEIVVRLSAGVIFDQRKYMVIFLNGWLGKKDTRNNVGKKNTQKVVRNRVRICKVSYLIRTRNFTMQSFFSLHLSTYTCPFLLYCRLIKLFA